MASDILKSNCRRHLGVGVSEILLLNHRKCLSDLIFSDAGSQPPFLVLGASAMVWDSFWSLLESAALLWGSLGMVGARSAQHVDTGSRRKFLPLP